jgi:murein hydrolase activator
LQRIGRRPLPAVMARPEDSLLSVRTAILLGAVLPDMKDEAETLVTDIGELVKVRKDITDERDKLSRDMVSLSEDRLRLGLLGEERKRRQGEVEKAIEAERRRATELARQAHDLKDLIGKLEAEIEGARRAAQAAARATEQQAKLAPSPEQKPNLGAIKDPGRLGPAIAFASAKGTLPLPVNGVKIRDFGASDGVGGLEKGLVLATRSGAQVTAPCDGWVVYSGTFRSYGQLLILNAGGGYHVLLAGMERMSVDIGQFVLTGEPVAVMGDGPKVASTIGVASSQPVLYIEFRKDGSPVDPTPWWANNDKQKVRG